MLEAVEIRGLTIAYERKGEGPPVVLLHGGLSDGREWRRQMDGLCDEHTVVAWDAPGCGRSSDPPETFRMTDYADCVAGLIDVLGLSPAHIAGLSFGGTLALELYRRHGELVRTLTLASAYAGWAGSLSPDTVAERLSTIMRDLESPPAEVARRWLPDLLSEQAPPELVEELVSIMSDFRASGARPMVRAMAQADLRDVLGEIEAPTLIVYGEADRRAPRALAESLTTQIPPARLLVLPRAGHQCNMEAADLFNEALRILFASA